MNNGKIRLVVFLSLFVLFVMSLIEKIVQPSYFIKSIIKLLVFSLAMFIYCIKYKENFFKLINFKKKGLSKGLILFMLFSYFVIIVGYLLLRNHIDLNGIRESLLNKEQLNKNNFIFIFSYIIFINSFLEESFFRGFIYNVFKKEGYEKIGVLFSALIFALYHIGIMDGWFNPFVMIVGVVGLFVTGIFLQDIVKREDNLLGSYLVHAIANLAINTIGTIMLFS